MSSWDALLSAALDGLLRSDASACSPAVMIPHFVSRRRWDDPVPFPGPRDEERPLCFVFDPELLAHSEGRRALLAFAAAGGITAYATTRIEGTALLELPDVPADYAPASVWEDVLTGRWIEDGGSHGIFGIAGVRDDLRRAAERAPTFNLPRDEAQRRVLLAAAAVETRDCDAVVSDDPAVRELAPTRARVLTSAEAVALIGLQARAREDFTLGPDLDPLPRWLFYWVMARELLPAGWPWFSACLASSRAPGGSSAVGDLAGAAITRLDRALRARDRFHSQAKRPPAGNDDDALFQFETTLLYLSAAFDVTARVAAIVYRLGQPRNANWRWKDWMRDLQRHDQALAALMSPEQPARDALEAVQLLRNTIHGEAIRGVEYQSGGDRRTMLEIPEREREQLLAVLERLGGRKRWGFAAAGSHSYVDPQLYLETLMEHAAPALNAILAATDVARLRGVTKAELTCTPQNEETPRDPRGRFDPFRFEFRRRVRVLAGFGDTYD